jgi:chorismate synthase
VRAAKKPISTLRKALESVNLDTKQAESANYERSDVCAVPAAAVVGEAMVSLILADALLEKFGGDSVAEIDAAWERYQDALSARLAPRPEPA